MVEADREGPGGGQSPGKDGHLTILPEAGVRLFLGGERVIEDEVEDCWVGDIFPTIGVGACYDLADLSLDILYVPVV